MRDNNTDIDVGPYGMTEITFYEIGYYPPLCIEHVFFGGGSRGTGVVSIKDAHEEVVADAYITKDGDRAAAGQWLMDMVVIRGPHDSDN